MKTRLLVDWVNCRAEDVGTGKTTQMYLLIDKKDRFADRKPSWAERWTNWRLRRQLAKELRHDK